MLTDITGLLYWVWDIRDISWCAFAD